MQQVLGKLFVANSGNNGIFSFNNMLDIYVPNFIPSYYLINTQDQAFYTNILFCLEARKAGHQYVVNSVRTQVNYILNTFNPDTRTFKDLPSEVRRNMFRTLHLSYSFTPGHNQAPPISDNITLTDLRGKLETIKYDAQKPLTSLEHVI